MITHCNPATDKAGSSRKVPLSVVWRLSPDKRAANQNDIFLLQVFPGTSEGLLIWPDRGCLWSVSLALCSAPKVCSAFAFVKKRDLTHNSSFIWTKHSHVGKMGTVAPFGHYLIIQDTLQYLNGLIRQCLHITQSLKHFAYRKTLN